MNRKIISFACILTLTFLTGGCRKSPDDTTVRLIDTCKACCVAADRIRKGFTVHQERFVHIYLCLLRKDGKALKKRSARAAPKC